MRHDAQLLHAAVPTGDVRLVRRLLDAGARADAVDDDAEQPLVHESSARPFSQQTTTEWRRPSDEITVPQVPPTDSGASGPGITMSE